MEDPVVRRGTRFNTAADTRLRREQSTRGGTQVIDMFLPPSEPANRRSQHAAGAPNSAAADHSPASGRADDAGDGKRDAPENEQPEQSLDDPAEYGDHDPDCEQNQHDLDH